MQRNPHSYQIATGYRTFYSLSLIYQPITKKRLFFIKKVIRMEKNIGEYLSRKSTEVIAIVACIGLIITIILAAGSIRTEQEKAHMVLHSSCLQTK